MTYYLPSAIQMNLHNWRQFEVADFEIDIRQSFAIVDANGSGKTSILAAIYSLLTSQPWPGTKFVSSLKQGEQYFGISTQDKEWFLSGRINNYGRLIPAYSSKFDILPKVITYQTRDNYWLLQPRETKLKELDILLSQINPQNYKNLINQQNHILRAKLNLLKHQREQNLIDYSLLFDLNLKLLNISQQIWSIRQDFFKFIDSSMRIINNWLDLESNLRIHARHEISNFNGVRQNIETINVINLEQLNQLWPREIQSGKLLFGSQRDNFVFEIKGQPLESYFSSGQLRLFTIFLKVLSANFNANEKFPIWFLFDDVLEELDSKRQQIIADQILSQGSYFVLTSSRNTIPPNIVQKSVSALRS